MSTLRNFLCIHISVIVVFRWFERYFGTKSIFANNSFSFFNYLSTKFKEIHTAISYFCTFAPVAYSGFLHSVIYLFNVGTISHSDQNKRRSLISVTSQNVVLIRNLKKTWYETIKTIGALENVRLYIVIVIICCYLERASEKKN